MGSWGDLEIEMSTSSIDITVIIPNWNGEQWLPGCLDALRLQRYQNFRTLVVDNGSHDRSRTILKNYYPWVESILLSKNWGFASAVNIGIRAAHTEYIVLLNNDTIPSAEWLYQLQTTIKTSPSDIGSLASCMVMMDNPSLIDDAGDTLSWFGSARKRGHGCRTTGYINSVEVFSSCAGATLYRHTALMKTGLFDEKFESYLEDVDLGLRLHLAGYRCLFVPDAIIIHKGHGSGIIKTKYIMFMTRNRLLLFLNNIPFPLLVKNLHIFIAGQIWYIIAYRNLFASCAGYYSFICMLPSVIYDRRRRRGKQLLSHEQIQSLLTFDKPG